MEPMRVNVLFVQFAYGGNGGVPMVLPSHAPWFAKTLAEVKADDRIKHAAITTLSDTPIPMTRNRSVQIAQENGFDMIFMLDSDNVPDSELKVDSIAKPFWQSSFDFAYERLSKGLPSLVCAPYCGPPPTENVYVFYWEGDENSPHSAFRVEGYSRDAASYQGGIREIAAGPTGVTLYTTGIFELMDPPYFYYEYKDKYQTEKASTEDVTNFRDLALNGQARHEGPVVFCNWDAWAGHTKVKEVRKPHPLVASDLNERFRDAMNRNFEHADRLVDFDFTGNLATVTNLPVETEPEPALDPLWEESYRVPTGDSSPSGVLVRQRVIFEHPVTTLGHQTPIRELERLRDIVETVAQQNEGVSLRVIEVGSWVGESAIAIANGFSSASGTVFCVDDFSGGSTEDPIKQAVDFFGPDAIQQHFVKNCGEYWGNEIKLLAGESRDLASELDRQDAHLIFLDAGHSYEDAKADIEAWLPHVAEDGFLCGHDYIDGWPGVIQAVNEAFNDRATIRVLEGTTIWLISKREYLECLRAEAPAS